MIGHLYHKHDKYTRYIHLLLSNELHNPYVSTAHAVRAQHHQLEWTLSYMRTNADNVRLAAHS